MKHAALLLLLCLPLLACSKQEPETATSKYLLDKTTWHWIDKSSSHTWTYELRFSASAIDGESESGSFENYYMSELTGVGAYERDGRTIKLTLDCKEGVHDLAFSDAEYLDYDKPRLEVHFSWNGKSGRSRTYYKNISDIP